VVDGFQSDRGQVAADTDKIEMIHDNDNGLTADIFDDD
jgi:hypothetical protein